MHFELNIIARNSNESDTNLYTLSETHSFPISDPPGPETIKLLIQGHIEKFKKTWPYRGTRHSILVPTEVTLKEVEA